MKWKKEQIEEKWKFCGKEGEKGEGIDERLLELSVAGRNDFLGYVLDVPGLVEAVR